MKISPLIYITLLVPFLGQAQTTFEKQWGFKFGDYGSDIRQTSDDGFVIVGYSTDTINFDNEALLLKIDQHGETEWYKTYGDSLHDDGRSIDITNDGGFILLANSGNHGLGKYSIGLIRTNSQGDTVWTKSYVADPNVMNFGWKVLSTNDKGFILTGWVEKTQNNHDIVVIKTDSLGNANWIKTYGGSNVEQAKSLDITVDGNYIIAGYSQNKIFLLKLDNNGDTLWTKLIDIGYLAFAESIKQTSDGGFIITGRVSVDTIIPYYSSFDIFLVKTNSNGDTLWTKVFNEGTDDYGMSVNEADDGGYVLTGSIGKTSSMDLFIMKTNSNGEKSWIKSFGKSDSTSRSSSSGRAILQTRDGGYAVTGFAATTGDFNIYGWQVDVIKTDGLGNITGIPETVLQQKNAIMFYPNPAKETLHFFLSAFDKQEWSLSITNVLGQVVKRLTTIYSRETNQIDITSLTPGMYIVSITNGQNIWNERIIKE